MASQSNMRVGDAEREATAGELREHFASGRLTQDEFDERLNQTFAAKTRADLLALFSDLPAPHPSFGVEPRPAPAPQAAQPVPAAPPVLPMRARVAAMSLPAGPLISV